MCRFHVFRREVSAYGAILDGDSVDGSLSKPPNINAWIRERPLKVRERVTSRRADASQGDTGAVSQRLTRIRQQANEIGHGDHRVWPDMLEGLRR